MRRIPMRMHVYEVSAREMHVHEMPTVKLWSVNQKLGQSEYIDLTAST